MHRFKSSKQIIKFKRKHKVASIVVSALLLCFNLFMSEIERPQLLTRAFDREYLVKNIGVFFYHIYDVALESKLRAEKVLADSDDIDEIQAYIKDEIRSNEQSELFGYAKDRNVFFISAESVQKFVIENTLHDEEITPFLNKLIDDKDTFYFENFYHQTAQGKTSDSEFITENSLYPLSSGAVFFTHAQNDYHSMPEILDENGYDSFVFHVNDDTFWNRNQMYEAMNITKFYDQSYYEVDKAQEVGWGMKDKEFFRQTVPMLGELRRPFYAKLITLTNHFPFELDEEDRTLEPYNSGSQTLNNYFPTVRYTDEAIEAFFDQLKEAGLYEDSVIVIMGDHDGISANHNKSMAEYLGKDEITLYDYQKLQRVPFIVHIPGIEEGKRMDRIAGQVDIKPTILHLLGVDTSHDIYFGNDLFHDGRKGYIAQHTGGFISDDYLLINDVCYDAKTGESLGHEVESSEEETPCSPLKEKVSQELAYSNKIVYGDLFRFINFNTK